jgi:hypothetical protein
VASADPAAVAAAALAADGGDDSANAAAAVRRAAGVGVLQGFQAWAGRGAAAHAHVGCVLASGDARCVPYVAEAKSPAAAAAAALLLRGRRLEQLLWSESNQLMHQGCSCAGACSPGAHEKMKQLLRCPEHRMTRCCDLPAALLAACLARPRPYPLHPGTWGCRQAAAAAPLNCMCRMVSTLNPECMRAPCGVPKQ